jgi:hypothetical protein
MRGIAFYCNTLYILIIKLFQGELLIMGCVYQATCDTTGRSYIGMTTKTLNRRSYEHRLSKDGTLFHKAIKKYGSDDFEWKVLYESKEEDALFKKERLFIKVFNTMLPHGYNMATGGKGSPDMYVSAKTRRRLLANARKAAMKIYCVELDRVFTSYREIREELHISNVTVKASVRDHERPVKKYHFCSADEVSILKLQNSYATGKLKYGHPVNMEGIMKAAEKQRGRKLTKEHIEKVRKALTGKTLPPRRPESITKWRATSELNGSIKHGANSPVAKPIQNLTDGRVFGSASEAVIYYKLPKHSPGNITLACQNENRTAYGYRWSYYKEEEVPQII